MAGKRLIYFILASFIVGNFLLIYIQYNSSKNIVSLTRGNEQVLNEFRTSNQLKDLTRDVVLLDSRLNAPETKDSFTVQAIEQQINLIEGNLERLRKISDNDSSVQYISLLKQLVHDKLSRSRRRVHSSKHASELNAAETGRALTDSIINVAQQFDQSRQAVLTSVTDSVDESGQKAMNFGTILIVLVLLSGAILFWFIISTLRRQQQLIEQLNLSEKKVRLAAQVKENFLANMSHEIRTPMNAILGYTQLLEQKKLDPTSIRYVQTIQQSGDHLLAILNDILDLSKMEAGMMQLEKKPFSIRDLLDSVHDLFEARMKAKGLRFTVAVTTDIPDWFLGDATRLRQVLVNLVGNALKFTDHGDIRIVAEGKTDANGFRMSITVSDTGIGMTEEAKADIFKRFHQADDSITRRFGGTGLGLSIVHDLVALHHGSITVESTPGKGSSFLITIPLEPTDKPADIAKPASTSSEKARQASITEALIAEDNTVNQGLLTEMLERLGITCTIAANGIEAIQRLREKPYPLLFLDIQMPGMDGYATAKYIREEMKSNVCIVAMTARVSDEERKKCLSLGMNEYLPKPIREQALHAVIDRLDAGEKLYHIINLDYMKEVSAGNIEYERTVTQQFLSAVPVELLKMEDAWQSGDATRLKNIAHNFRTTVSIMGLLPVLSDHFDVLENIQAEPAARLEALREVQTKSRDACIEAEHLLSSLNTTS